MNFTDILKAYNLNENEYKVIPFGNGLINHTWKVSAGGRQKAFILQQINTDIFQQPEAIANNIRVIGDYFAAHFPGYLFLAPVKTSLQQDMYVNKEHEYFRLFPFLDGSQSYDVVSSPSQAYQAARQFGLFTRQLSGFDVGRLQITLPHFHDLELRFHQFKQALVQGNRQRIDEAKHVINFLLSQQSIVTTFQALHNNLRLPVRVIHHDTKISNVLFDKQQQGLCVIDLDTMMPGYFISDFGDMMRTYLSPVSEEEKDYDKIELRDDYFLAIVEGYLSAMKDELSKVEKEHMVYAGKFMIYMQALRFLTDHLNNDAYYGARYEGHNLVRAGNQMVLLQKLIEKEALFTNMVNSYSCLV